METQLLQEVIECLSDERRLVHYYEDKYALYLLEKFFCSKNELSINQIKASSFSKLLQRPQIKQLVANCGGKISKEQLQSIITNDYQTFVITLSTWGRKQDYSWAQTSAPGTNLVMQLNMTNQHDQQLSRLNVNAELFKYYGHPIHESKNSLSWARIDFDFNTGEALIEEIQNDYLRKAKKHLNWSKNTLKFGFKYYKIGEKRYSAKKMLAYTQDLLTKYQKRWHEMTLFCAIKLIKEDIGINKIFYHTIETGKILKNISGQLPPRSLYTDLPKKFCFEQCNTGPEFIIKNKKIRKTLRKVKQAQWHQLIL